MRQIPLKTESECLSLLHALRSVVSRAEPVAMSDVAAAPALPMSDQSEKPSSSLSQDQIAGANALPSRHVQPSTVTNGPAGEPILSSSAQGLDSGLAQPARDSADLSQSSTADKEDQELYGTGGHADGDGNKANEKSKETNDESDDDPFAGLEDFATMDLYDLANYTFGKKNEECKSRIMQDISKQEISAALEKRYDERGMRRSVGAVILVHSHNFPHILLVQRSDSKGEYALPGGRLRPGESDEEGLQRKLASKLRPSDSISGDEEEQQLDVGDKLCTWHAIDFTRKYYPYVPAHVTKPKEALTVYAVSLPSKFVFAVPNNLQLVAVPLFELFNNSSTYGDVISAIPSLLSRYHINYC